MKFSVGITISAVFVLTGCALFAPSSPEEGILREKGPSGDSDGPAAGTDSPVPNESGRLQPAFQSLPWVRTGGPEGGLGYDIRMRPDNPDIMYVTDAWAGIHMSVDGGKTWSPSNEGIEGRTGPSGDAIPIFCLTIDPNDHDIVWAGMQDLGTIYRSADGGRTWEKRSRGITEGQGLTFRGITVEPGNSNVVYAAGEIGSHKWAGREMPGLFFDRTMGVVYKSENAGGSWEPVWRGDNLARYILIDPRDHDVLYVSTGIFDREAANSDPESNEPGGVGILKSVDGGRSWTPVNRGLGNLFAGSLFMHPENPDVLLAGVGHNSYFEEGGIYLSSDGGGSWQHRGGNHITSVEFSESNPDIAYAGGDGRQLFRSQDGGYTWVRLISEEERGWGPPGIRPGFPIDFQVDPRNPDRIFANNYGGGNFLSEDGGKSWISSSTGYTGADIGGLEVSPKNPAVLFTSGPFFSRDGGKTWTGLNTLKNPGCRRIVPDPGDPDHLIMAMNEGAVFDSTDGGYHWRTVFSYNRDIVKRFENGEMSLFQGLHAITYAPSDSRRVYGGWAVNGCVSFGDREPCGSRVICSLLTSTDGGRSWIHRKNTPFEGSSITAIVVHPHDPDTVWVATPSSGIFRTSDGGSTWELTSAHRFEGMVLSMTGDPQDPRRLYLGLVRGGVYRSEDGGEKWRKQTVGMDPNESIGSIVLDPVRPHILYAGSWNSGVFLSEDSGGNWTRINAGLRTRSVRELAISSDGATLYAGTRGEGVFRLSALSQEELSRLGNSY